MPQNFINSFKIKSCFILAFIFCLSPLSAQAACPLPLKVGYEHYPPYQIAPDQPIESGYDFEVVEAIGKEINCPIEWVYRPWKRILNDLEAGRIDLTSSALITLERQDFAYFSPAYRIAERVLYVRNDIKSENLESFLNDQYRLGLISGYIYSEILDVNNETINPLIEFGNSTKLTIPKITNNRIDGTIEEKAVFNYYLKTQNAKSKIRETGEVLQTTPMHIMVSKKSVSKQLTIKIFDAIKTLTQEGRLKEIAQKYKK